MSASKLKNVLIPLTGEQLAQLKPLFAQLENGGALFGQIWSDGIHAVVLDADRTALLYNTLNKQSPDHNICGHLRGSAAEAFELAKIAQEEGCN